MTTKTCWIECIVYTEADADLRAVYDTVTGPSGRIDNLYKAYGLRRHILPAADTLYRATLHCADNTLPTWLLELIGTQVALLAGCDYAFTHHAHNFKALLGDPKRGDEILDAVRDQHYDGLDDREAAVLRYVERLTLSPAAVRQGDVAAMQQAGLSDGEVLEVNQVAASFAYWTRVINGLGIALGDEKVGFYD